MILMVWESGSWDNVLNGEVMGGVAVVANVSVLVQRIGLGCGLVEWVSGIGLGLGNLGFRF